MNSLKDFQLPEETTDYPPSNFSRNGFKNSIFKNLRRKILKNLEKYFGIDSKITRFFSRLSSSESNDKFADNLIRLKESRSWLERLKSALIFILMILMLLTWKSTLPMLKEADQLKNDLKEQDQLIIMEQQNKSSLDKLAGRQEMLDENLSTLSQALPRGDEKAEEMISVLEAMAAQNRMIIDGIGIRKIPESQINYNDLIGLVDVYEYTFTLENDFANISSFMRDVRSSLRLMDIMSLEIEESKGAYRANFVLHAYHLTS